MLITKTRTEGNAIVVTLPQSDHRPIFIDKEYLVIYNEDESITLVPMIANPFSTGAVGEYYFPDEWADIPLAGEELI